MEKNIKTGLISEVFDLISTAKLTKMGDEGKIKVWRLCRALKPIAKSFKEGIDEAREKFAPNDHFYQDFEMARQYELAKSKGEAFEGVTEEFYQEVVEQYRKFNKLVSKAVNEASEKEVTVDFEPLTDDELEMLAISNDWNFKSLDLLSEMM